LSKGSLQRGYYALDDGIPGKPFTTYWLEKKVVKTGKSRVLEEILALIFLVEALKPRRIASIHGKRPLQGGLDAIAKASGDLAATEKAIVDDVVKHKQNAPGIYVDPRYTFSTEAERKAKDRKIDPQKFNTALEPAYPQVKPPEGTKTTFSAINTKQGGEDDDVALQIAKAVVAVTRTISPKLRRGNFDWRPFSPFLAVGNRLRLEVAGVHYGAEPAVRSDFAGFSLGDWGPVDVEYSSATDYGIDGERKGAPVYTIETFGYAHSGAFVRTPNGFEQLVNEDGTSKGKNLPKVFDAVRSAQLQAYAEGLRTVLLEEYKPSQERLEQAAKQILHLIATLAAIRS
jgi:hypothetical protein